MNIALILVSDPCSFYARQIASRKALPFALATADSSYAREEYGLDEAGIEAVSSRLRKTLARERRAGTVRTVSSIADLQE
jgi:hypothetical protein